MKVRYLLIIIIILAACKKEKTIPEKLPGIWTDYNKNYYFKETNNYGIKFLKQGIGKDSVNMDSLWGTYSYDQKRNNITFMPKAYISKAGDTITGSLLSNTWHIKFINDTTIKFESSSSLGRMVKISKPK